jgi:hypothetical protein
LHRDGSTAAAAWPRISKISPAMAWRSSVSPPSASCDESSVLTNELSGPVLRLVFSVKTNARGFASPWPATGAASLGRCAVSWQSCCRMRVKLRRGRGGAADGRRLDSLLVQTLRGTRAGDSDSDLTPRQEAELAERARAKAPASRAERAQACGHFHTYRVMHGDASRRLARSLPIV